MAWLEQKTNGIFHLGFRFSGKKFKKSLRTSDKITALTRLHRLEENIALVESGRLRIPDDADIITFLLSDGEINRNQFQKSVLRTLKQFTDAFLKSIPKLSIENNTLRCVKIHLSHLKRIFGSSLLIRNLTLEHLQAYVDRRSSEKSNRGKSISTVTIKKEIATFRAMWNWARHAGHLNKAFPANGLRYPKATEKPPFQTWGQINRTIELRKCSAKQQKELWDSLFLTSQEIDQLLNDIKDKSPQPCIFPMFVFAAHTGARRSEIFRSQVQDIDLAGRTIRIREKKRVRGRFSTRQVPISPILFNVLSDWLKTHPGNENTFFLKYDKQQNQESDHTYTKPLECVTARYYFKQALAKTKWSVIRGWHVFRHSFCSNCAAAGIDQRMINAWVGHQTEEMVKRYRHLLPDQQQSAIEKVFPACT